MTQVSICYWVLLVRLRRHDSLILTLQQMLVVILVRCPHGSAVHWQPRHTQTQVVEECSVAESLATALLHYWTHDFQRHWNEPLNYNKRKKRGKK